MAWISDTDLWIRAVSAVPQCFVVVANILVDIAYTCTNPGSG